MWTKAWYCFLIEDYRLNIGFAMKFLKLYDNSCVCIFWWKRIKKKSVCISSAYYILLDVTRHLSFLSSHCLHCGANMAEFNNDLIQSRLKHTTVETKHFRIEFSKYSLHQQIFSFGNCFEFRYFWIIINLKKF